MRVLVATAQVPFVRGGAEVLLEGLVGTLRARGHEVDVLGLPARIGPERELAVRTTLGARALDLRSEFDRVIALKFPAWLVRHPHKTLWVIHQERAAFDGWEEGLSNLPEGRLTRNVIAAADVLALSEADSVFAISRNVARRLSEVFDVHVPVLYPPPLAVDELSSSGRYEPFFFFPGRIASSKRHALVIEALARTEEATRLVIAGKEDVAGAEDALRRLARSLEVEDRIRWLGHCSDGALRDHFARARAVVFPALDEDYGLVTSEAMLAQRPVITCSDSGGPLEMVGHEEEGLIADPTPDAIARAMDRLWRDESLTRQLGAAGRARFLSLGITWEKVANSLLGETG